jgi:hypothetical protein
VPVHGAQSPGGPSRKQNRAIKPPLPHDPVCPKGRDLIRLIKELRIKRAALSCLSSRTSTLQLRLSVVLERKPVRGIGEISEAVPLAGLRCGTADPHSVNRLKPDPRLAVHPRSSIPEAPARRLVASMTVRGGRPHHTFASSRRRGAGHCCCQRYRGPCLGPGGETRSGASCSTWTLTPCPSSRATPKRSFGAGNTCHRRGPPARSRNVQPVTGTVAVGAKGTITLQPGLAVSATVVISQNRAASRPARS